jgi:hypothetical protein
MLDLDRHNEHYIICPGGRDVFKQDIAFIYSFDIASEKWTATTFPELQKPMFYRSRFRIPVVFFLKNCYTFF